MARDMYGSMAGPSAWMMTARWETSHIVLLWVMWAVMMAVMMLPTAAPMLLLYAVAMRKREPDEGASVPVYLFAAGYLVVWAVFSLGATLLQRVLAQRLLLTPMFEPASLVLTTAPLVLAGVYQLTPLKRACLESCRSPVAFITRHWRGGFSGALRMGVDHGVHCVGCCWALMLLLFAGGVMNLQVIVALTLLVLVEKVLPYGAYIGRIAGGGFLAAALWVVAHR